MSEKAKILFVDDEEAIRSLILTVLEGDGHTAHGVGTAAAAVQAMTDTPYDLVVIDKNLPDGSGIDLLRDLKRKHPETEFMVLTGYPSLESAIEALRAGAFDYLIKPVLDLDLVTQKVSRALERRRLLRQAYRGAEEAAESDAARLAQALAKQAGALRAAVDGGKAAEAKDLANAVDEAAQELARRLGRG